MAMREWGSHIVLRGDPKACLRQRCFMLHNLRMRSPGYHLWRHRRHVRMRAVGWRESLHVW